MSQPGNLEEGLQPAPPSPAYTDLTTNEAKPNSG